MWPASCAVRATTCRRKCASSSSASRQAREGNGSQLKDRSSPSGQGTRSRGRRRRRSAACNVVATSVDGADAAALAQRGRSAQKPAENCGRWCSARSRQRDGKVTLIAGVTPDATARVKAGDARELRRAAGRRQGRRSSRSCAGRGSQPQNLAAALESVAEWVARKLS